MDAPNSTPDQEREGEQQLSALLIVCEKDNSQEASDHAPMVSGTAQLPMLLLTIAALSLAAGSRNKTYLGDQAISSHIEGASRSRTRGSKFAFPAARLVGLYRRLWESYVSKHIDGENQVPAP
ncbi:hypothetical protein PENARI_c050G04566 [Penicillium arizonense]|uniref:Uncharacterized protein n=1 Tax=Penicillium arizonense TaxID=1835702 RepID=A0A1F5L2T1_PENAI|nr:hypothetical protein PENARI_c050G04566 [Penicillium arizonense]OGE47310.1 hypothetical protein PENARI_c050G04566 [Penicillium arizonense]